MDNNYNKKVSKLKKKEKTHQGKQCTKGMHDASFQNDLRYNTSVTQHSDSDYLCSMVKEMQHDLRNLSRTLMENYSQPSLCAWSISTPTVSDEDLGFLTTKEVCEILKVTERTVYNHVKSGKLKRIGMSSRHHLFQKSDILDFLKKKEHRSDD